MIDSVRLIVNGVEREALGSPRTPLLFLLRNDLGLKGAKLGCGTGACGACMVIVNGRAVNSCTVSVGDIEGAEIETVEGAGEDAVLKAFLDLQAAQCGYCIPGIMMTARALLRREPRASRETIVAALSERHLCRCGTHTRILAAIGVARDMT